MKNKKLVLAIDVDNTLVDVVPAWEKWYHEHFDEDNFVEKANTPEVLAFWADVFLYDRLTPEEEVVKQAKFLTENFDVIVVSKCFPEHVESKKRFVRGIFGNVPFYDTNVVDESTIYADILIDDRSYRYREMKKANPTLMHIGVILSNSTETALQLTRCYDPAMLHAKCVLTWPSIFDLLNNILSLRRLGYRGY